MNSRQRLRTRLVGLGILIVAGVLLSSLYKTSIVRGDEFQAKANVQYARPKTSLFARGTIFFSDKEGIETAAATVGSGHLLFMNPKSVTDPGSTFEALSSFVSLDKKAFLAKAAKINDPYEELLHQVSPEIADSIEGLELAGIGLVPESWRSYPGGMLAAHTLGIIGENASSTVSGRYGLERYYDEILTRKGVGSSVNVFAELFSGLNVFGSDDVGGNLITTIEPKVQSYLEKVLTETEKSWDPDEAGGIIMDPSTGEIFALAAHPSFDPNKLKSLTSSSLLTNPLIEHVYEMGSIMKPLTMAVALDSGAVKTTSTYNDEGCMTLDEKKICNYDHRARGITSMQEILSQSLNMGAATIALKTGADDFARYLNSFGIGSKSEIDLPNEATPLVKSLKRANDIDIATASYGQGIAVSPVGMARALSVIANGGYVIRPHIVKEIDYVNGETKIIDVKKEGPILKPETTEDVKRMLVKVVDEALQKGAIKREHYTVAAKTGTAAIADPINGGYYDDRYLHSFFGFFPAYNPKFIVFLYQIHPKGALYASETLVKPFDDLTSFLLNYYNIPPDR